MRDKLEICLYIGKFQPFHNGHMKVIDLLRNSFNSLIVAIGSSQNNSIFSIEERVRMLYENTGIQNPYLLRDLEEGHPYYWGWGGYVLGQVGEVDVVATGNKHVKTDFLKKDIPVLWLPRYYGISGAAIRKKIMSRDNGWIEMVPKKTKRIVKESNYYKKYL